MKAWAKSVANGDLLSGVNLTKMLDFHRVEKADLTIATHREYHRLKLKEVIAEEGRRVIDYLEKPVKSYQISSGIYLVEPPLIALCKGQGWLQFPTLVKRAIEVKLKVLEYPHTEPWIDINCEDDLKAAQEIFFRIRSLLVSIRIGFRKVHR